MEDVRRVCGVIKLSCMQQKQDAWIFWCGQGIAKTLTILIGKLITLAMVLPVEGISKDYGG
jgi:hypothetical protein